MADNTKLLLFGGAAVAAWWFFLRPSAVVAVPAAVAPAATVPPAGHVLDNIFAGMVAKAGADHITSTGPDTWNVYAVRAGAPDPMPAPEDAGLTRVDMSAAQYWAGMAPVLASTKGLSGLGRYGNLATFAMSRGLSARVH